MRLSTIYIINLFILLGFITTAILHEQIAGFRTFIGILGAVVSSLFLFTILHNKKILAPTAVIVSFCAFLLWMLVSLFYSKDLGNSIWEVLKMFSFLLLFLTVYNMIKKEVSLVPAILVPFAIISVIIATRDLYGFIASGGLGEGRYLIGSFFWHNQMAGFLLFVIPLVFALFLSAEKFFLKVFFGLGTLISLFAIILTYSRAGWLSLFLSFVLFAVFSRRIIWANARYVLVLVGIFLFLFLSTTNLPLATQKAKSIFQELFSQTRTVSGDSRTTAWETSLRMIQSAPVFGVGPGAFGVSYYGFQKKPWLYTSEAHNQFLQVAAEVGIPGFLFFTGIFIFTAVAIYKKRQIFANNKKSLLLVGVVSGLFGSLLHAFLDFDWSTVALFLLFWIFLAIILSVVSEKEISVEIKGVGRLFYLFPLVLMLISFLLLRADTDYKKARRLALEGEFIDSEERIKRAIKLNPFDGRYYYILGSVLQEQKKDSLAKLAYQKTMRLNPYNFEIYYNLGLMEFQNNNDNKAKVWLEKAILLNPYSRPKIYKLLSQVYLKLGDKKGAERILRTAIYKAFPLNRTFRGFEYIYDYVGVKKDLALLYLGLAMFEVDSGKKEEAKELLRVVEKDLDPQNPLLPVFKKLMSE